MKETFIVSLYKHGETHASDCYADYLPTREEAEAIGKACLFDSGKPEAIHWAVRYTVDPAPTDEDGEAA